MVLSSTVVNGSAHACLLRPDNNSLKTAWLQPGPAAFDLRSDTVTTANPGMLKAITDCGLNDGWSGNGAQGFEEYMAGFVSRDAALFMVSSTMGNQVAIRTHLQRPPNGVLCDARSHIICMEAGSMAHLSGALAQTVMPSNGLYLTLDDIKSKIVLSDGTDSCTCPTRLIHLENPLGGVVMPLVEMHRIKRFAEEHGIKVHCDGARIWEAVAAGYGTIGEFCSEADSVNICLTKGIGASVGAILIGDTAFIKHAKWVRKSIGGAIRQPSWVAAAAWAAVNSVFGLDPTGANSLMRESHAQARALTDHWVQHGGKLVVPQETNMIWLDLDAAGIDDQEWEILGQEAGLKIQSSRIIIHYQIREEAVERLKVLMSQVLQSGRQPYTGLRFPRQDIISRLVASMREAVALSHVPCRGVFHIQTENSSERQH